MVAASCGATSSPTPSPRCSPRPWFASVTQGTVALNVWLRMLGARIGHGVWCDTYWLPETDLVELHDGSTVNHGCVVQTHLFHDRVLAHGPGGAARRVRPWDPTALSFPPRRSGVTPRSVRSRSVMRGEGVPSRTRWIGNPIGPWEADAA